MKLKNVPRLPDPPVHYLNSFCSELVIFKIIVKYNRFYTIFSHKVARSELDIEKLPCYSMISVAVNLNLQQNYDFIKKYCELLFKSINCWIEG